MALPGRGYVGRVKRAIATLFVLFVGLLYAAVPASAAPAPAASGGQDGIPKVLRVGTEGVYPPFSYHGGTGSGLTGYDIDVMNAIGAHLGVKVEYVDTPFD